VTSNNSGSSGSLPFTQALENKGHSTLTGITPKINNLNIRGAGVMNTIDYTSASV